MIIATAGHVDHGKTLLIKSLTGVDTDRLPEEKERGLTIDLGFAYHDVGDGQIMGFVDVPGHERFIRNMLAGVAGIDFALLIVAADDGPMPQTLEHLAILNFLGIRHGAIALTKIDRVDANRLTEVENQIAAVLAGTLLEDAPVFRVSAISGDGMDALRDHLETTAKSMAARGTNGHFRLAVDRSFTVTGAGLIATGTVFSGQIKVGDHLTVSPSGLEVRVRGIHAQNQASENGVAGQRCAVNIVGQDIRKSQIHRGDWLLSPASHAPTDRLDALVQVAASETKALRHWTPGHMHVGADDVTCRIAVLEGGSIAPGESGLVQIVLDAPIGTLRGDRLILRDQSARRTIAGGEVIDPFSPKRGRAKPERLAHLAAMSKPTPTEALAELLDVSPEGVDLNQFARAWNFTKPEANDVWAELKFEQLKSASSAWGLSPDHWKLLTSSVLDVVDETHAGTPHLLGPGEDDLAKLLPRRYPLDVTRAALQSLLSAEALSRRGTVFHRPDHKAQPTDDDLAIWRRAEPLLIEGGRRPPRVRELAETLDIELAELEGFLGRATQFGWLFKVAGNRYYPPAAAKELALLVEQLAAEDHEGFLTATAYKDLSGIGRNVSINVLEFFNKVGFTQRIGNSHRIVRSINDVFGD